MVSVPAAATAITIAAINAATTGPAFLTVPMIVRFGCSRLPTATAVIIVAVLVGTRMTSASKILSLVFT